MVEAVNHVVNTPQKKSKVLPLTLAGLGVGAIGGGVYGYKSKSWIKSGALTDDFVRTASNNLLDNQMKQNPDAKEFLKSLKALLNLNIKKDISEENLIKLLEKNANIFEIEAKEGQTLVDAVKEFIKEEGGKDKVLDVIFKTKEGVADDVKRQFDLEKAILKPLKENATQDDKDIFKILQNTIKDFNKKAAVKWAAIGAAALAGVGLIIGCLVSKNKTNKEVKNS